MAISYKKLWKLLIDKDMKKKDLQQLAGVSAASITKLGKSSFFFISRTASLLSSSRTSRRRITVIGRITSRYFPRTYTSRRQSSAIPHIKLTIAL